MGSPLISHFGAPFPPPAHARVPPTHQCPCPSRCTGPSVRVYRTADEALSCEFEGKQLRVAEEETYLGGNLPGHPIPTYSSGLPSPAVNMAALFLL